MSKLAEARLARISHTRKVHRGSVLAIMVLKQRLIDQQRRSPMQTQCSADLFGLHLSTGARLRRPLMVEPSRRTLAVCCWGRRIGRSDWWSALPPASGIIGGRSWSSTRRSEEHTSELQSRGHLVCRLLLEKKKKTQQR